MTFSSLPGVLSSSVAIGGALIGATKYSVDAGPLSDLIKVTSAVCDGPTEERCDFFFCFLKHWNPECSSLPQDAHRVFLWSFLGQVVEK